MLHTNRSSTIQKRKDQILIQESSSSQKVFIVFAQSRSSSEHLSHLSVTSDAGSDASLCTIPASHAPTSFFKSAAPSEASFGSQDLPIAPCGTPQSFTFSNPVDATDIATRLVGPAWGDLHDRERQHHNTPASSILGSNVHDHTVFVSQNPSPAPSEAARVVTPTSPLSPKKSILRKERSSHATEAERDAAIKAKSHFLEGHPSRTWGFEHTTWVETVHEDLARSLLRLRQLACDKEAINNSQGGEKKSAQEFYQEDIAKLLLQAENTPLPLRSRTEQNEVTLSREWIEKTANSTRHKCG